MATITKPIALDETLQETNNKLQLIINKLGNVQSVNGHTGNVQVTFTTLTATLIDQDQGDYRITLVPGSVS